MKAVLNLPCCAYVVPDKKIGSWIMMKVCKKEEDALQVDFALLRGCKREVQQHCSDPPADQLLHCLKDWAGQDANFDQTCLAVIRCLFHISCFCIFLLLPERGQCRG